MSPAETGRERKSVMVSGLAGRIALPPLLAFLLVSVYVVAEALGYRGLARAEAETASEAAALGHAAETLRLIVDGQHPNQPQHVRAGFLDAGDYEVTPLEAAILGRHTELVRLLLRTSAAPVDTSRASCFARTRLPEVLTDLGTSGSQSADPMEIPIAYRMCGNR